VPQTDAILKVTSAAICGSDLHLYHNCLPGMKRGDQLGHEFMGEVVEVGEAVKNVKKVRTDLMISCLPSCMVVTCSCTSWATGCCILLLRIANQSINC
jgi:threonine dehydrogenase-like Zn-dependent dehydrogenase